MRLALFLILSAVAAIGWGRVTRVGYAPIIALPVRFIMKYSRMSADRVHSYLVWAIYMCTGMVIALALLVAYRVDLLSYFGLSAKYIAVVPLGFIAGNSLTGFLMQILLVIRPNLDVFRELTNVPWIRYTLMLQSVMRTLTPLLAAGVEEMVFRGAVFLILLKRFPHDGHLLPIVVCTVLFVVQQMLQTDTSGQRLILAVGSTSISVVGCLMILYTGSFLPALLCHAAYAFVYLKLGAAMPRRGGSDRRVTSASAYPSM
jgi:membrane protease YdiL (CAAX protease family)